MNHPQTGEVDSTLFAELQMEVRKLHEGQQKLINTTTELVQIIEDMQIQRGQAKSEFCGISEEHL